MKTETPRLQLVAGNDFRPGKLVIHFYYSPQEQMRFSTFLTEGLRLGQGVVLASRHETAQALIASARIPRLTRLRRSIEQVVITRDIASSVAILVTAVHEAAMQYGQARVLVDFADFVQQDQIFEVEADLSSSFRGQNVVCITQYNGNAFSAPIALEQFKTHSLAIVGNAFYYENSRHIAPEQYLRKRAAGAD